MQSYPAGQQLCPTPFPLSQVDSEILALQDEIFLSKVKRARRMSIDERMMEGLHLFDRCLSLMRDGITTSHPEFSPEQVEQEVRRRLAIARRLDDAGLYRPAGVVGDDE